MKHSQRNYHCVLGEHFDDPGVLGRTTVGAHQTVALLAGVYEETIPEPPLNLELTTHSQVVVSRSRDEEPGDYSITLRVSNRGNEPVDVLLRDLDASDGGDLLA